MNKTKFSDIDFFDGDGYPTQKALLEVSRYNCLEEGIKGYLDLIKNLWSYPDRFVLKDNILYLSTGGWSGNEDVISTMKNNFFWFLCHIKWKKGGHYWFDIKCFNPKEKDADSSPSERLKSEKN